MYKIRFAAVQDIKNVAKAHVDSWRTTYDGIVDQGYLSALKYEDRERLWEQTDLRQLLVAEDGLGNIAGFASFGKERTGKYEYVNELYAIYLLKQCQKQGIGRKLFCKAIEELIKKGEESLMLWVFEENPSRKFYEKYDPEFIDEDYFEISGKKHTEIAYGWKDLSKLAEKLKDGE